MSAEQISTEWKVARSRCFEKRADLLKTGRYSDVEFIFDDEGKETKIRAHGLFLTEASDVFEAMMFADFAREEKITIVDIKPDSFHLMLKYIYGDFVYVKSTDTAFDLYAAANKYLLSDLMNICVDYLDSNLSIENVWRVSEFSDLYEIKRLKEWVMVFCKEHIEGVISSEGFLSAPVDMVITLFQRGPFQMENETLLLDAALAYAINRTSDDQDIVSEIIKVFQNIKFDKLSAIEYADWMHKNENALYKIDEKYFLKSFANFYYRKERKVDLFVRDSVFVFEARKPQSSIRSGPSCTSPLGDDQLKNHKTDSQRKINQSRRTIAFESKKPKIVSSIGNIKNQTIISWFDSGNYTSIHNADGNLKKYIQIKFSSRNRAFTTHADIYVNLNGVQISTQIQFETLKSCDRITTYKENLTFALCENNNVLHSQVFVGEAFFDGAMWINFDEPFKLVVGKVYTMSVQFNQIGHYAMYCKQQRRKTEVSLIFPESGSVEIEFNDTMSNAGSQFILGLKLVPS